ncbi:hypothetical protein O0L34_g17515 [Tuta absoluta]|nr:hypothetical protein O0L34_g17515 [Tuta absoluta]
MRGGGGGGGGGGGVSVVVWRSHRSGTRTLANVSVVGCRGRAACTRSILFTVRSASASATRSRRCWCGGGGGGGYLRPHIGGAAAARGDGPSSPERGHHSHWNTRTVCRVARARRERVRPGGLQGHRRLRAGPGRRARSSSAAERAACGVRRGGRTPRDCRAAPAPALPPRRARALHAPRSAAVRLATRHRGDDFTLFSMTAHRTTLAARDTNK